MAKIGGGVHHHTGPNTALRGNKNAAGPHKGSTGVAHHIGGAAKAVGQGAVAVGKGVVATAKFAHGVKTAMDDRAIRKGQVAQAKTHIAVHKAIKRGRL